MDTYFTINLGCRVPTCVCVRECIQSVFLKYTLCICIRNKLYKSTVYVCALKTVNYDCRWSWAANGEIEFVPSSQLNIRSITRRVHKSSAVRMINNIFSFKLKQNVKYSKIELNDVCMNWAMWRNSGQPRNDTTARTHISTHKFELKLIILH